ncbi:MAG: sterol desaturase [Bradyrhizobium sp.]|nr:sterol desaturase [Bradyrhizobium sp.]
MLHALPFPIVLGLRAVGWLALSSLIFLPLEAMFPVKRAGGGGHELGANLGWFFVNALLTLPLLTIPTALIAYGIQTVIPPAILTGAASLPLWARMALAMIVGEIGFYWGHRWSHASPWLWRFHAVHHSATRLSYLVNTRMHPVDMAFTRLCGVLLLIATGLASPLGGAMDNMIVGFVLLSGSLWSYLIHANVRLRLRLLAWIVATPKFHHWHHAYGNHRGHNFASMLPVMDKLFGTYRVPAEWPGRYGTATPVGNDLTSQFLAPFRSARLPSPESGGGADLAHLPAD